MHHTIRHWTDYLNQLWYHNLLAHGFVSHAALDMYVFKKDVCEIGICVNFVVSEADNKWMWTN